MSEPLTAKEKLQELAKQRREPSQGQVTVETQSNARDLSPLLQGSDKMKQEEEKSIYLSMKPRQKPEVTFAGFWNGTLIKAAMDSIAKAYRLRKYKNIRPQASTPTAMNNTVASGAAEKQEG